ncbi:MAG: diguanylate cyclase [Defluviitaleaceae bacterium]|nr:diguanylate cyclase [Defluviitaleaceae bacterium]
MTENFNILIVDDERANIDVLSHMLKSDYKISIAKSGAQALERAKRDEPDLILLDIIMPDMSGFDVLSELKETENTNAIPVICITGLDSVEHEEKGFSLGAVDYITKPFHQCIVKARIATHLRIVEQMRIIEQIGLIDALTGIPNRRSFDNRLATEWGRAVREKSSLSMLMIDVDHFKKFNDDFGHQQGDLVLKKVAETIKTTLKRPGDFFARWGGEEFAALLPSTSSAGALRFAEAIRINIQTNSNVTVSIGNSSLIPTHDDKIKEFVEHADKALYVAKASGRNRVC